MKRKGIVLFFMGFVLAFGIIGFSAVYLPTKLSDTYAFLSSLYAPWRGAYKGSIQKTTDCPFCTKRASQNDRNEMILGRYQHFMICLNRFPYSPGHMLIIPNQHVKDIKDLPKEAHEELVRLIVSATDILREELHADGINVGVNLGKAAGASIPDHLHIHVVPRWYNPEGFIESVARTTVISTEFDNIYQKLVVRFHS